MERVGDLPVQSQLAPGDIRDMLPAHAPEEPEDFEEITADLDRIVVPGLTNWVSPGWFAFFPAATLRPREFSASWSRPASASRACCGPPARSARSWRT